jgi:hypothetical protein
MVLHLACERSVIAIYQITRHFVLVEESELQRSHSFVERELMMNARVILPMVPLETITVATHSLKDNVRHIIS